MAGLFTLRAFARNLLRENRRRNIFLYFVLMPDLGYAQEKKKEETECTPSGALVNEIGYLTYLT